jgi:hypothetical protein
MGEVSRERLNAESNGRAGCAQEGVGTVIQ